MGYVLEPSTVESCARRVVGLPHNQKFSSLIRHLHEAYPRAIANEEPNWIFNNAGGAMGQISVLYASLKEYLLVFGTPIGTEGHSGRYSTDVWDFMLEGEMWCYHEGETERTVYRAGDTAFLGRNLAKGYRVPDHAWMLEYCRGPVPTMLPFGLGDVASSTLDVKAGARTLWHYSRHVARSFRP